MVAKNSWGSNSVSSDGGVSWGSNDVGLGVLDNRGGAGNLDDVLSTDWNWDWDMVWLVDMDWGWDLDDLLNVPDDFIWDVVWSVNWVWFVDSVWLPLDGDDWSVDLLSSPQVWRNLDIEVGEDWLQDLGVVSGNVLLGSVVDLLGDLLWCLVNRLNSMSLDLGSGVWSWDADWSSVSHSHWSSSVGNGNWSSSVVGWGSGSRSNDGSKDGGQRVHDEDVNKR